MGFSWNAAITWPNGEDRLCKLAKYLVARYGAYPVIWTIGGELPGYGGGDKTALRNADAHLKAGMAYRRLGDNASARAEYNELFSRFPGSEAAKRARGH